MVAVCGRPESAAQPAGPAAPGCLPDVDGIDDLATRWAGLGYADGPGVATRLATVLHHLAGTLRGEPFSPLAARDLGADLLSTGLCGDAGRLRHPVEDVLPASLGLLRREAPAALGVCGPEGERRLAAVLDELAIGFACGLRDRTHREDQPPEWHVPPQASYQDQLAALPNRARTERWLRRSFGPGGPARVGMCALDLDGFGGVNDGFGHQVGDQLLLAVAERLQQLAGRHLVTRTGGDEFAVLVAGPDGPGEVLALAEEVLSALATPFHVAGQSLTISASIGVAESATADACTEELMRAADVALTWAKACGGGRGVAFDPVRDAGESARSALLAGLRAAVDRGEFRLAFQPLVGLSDGRVQGVEALVRWQHPTRGLIGPDRFIELAEQGGAIVPLGHWVLADACRHAAGWWRELGERAPYVSVNVSPVQLTEADWVGDVTGVLDATGLPPHLLQLEITEQAMLGDEAAALAALGALRAAGVRLALDDFGTGWSSLAWLRRLPVHALKIDGSFIDGLRHVAADQVDGLIVRALVELAHALGLEVTAEWVETSVQAQRLVGLGCDVGQGRYFGDAGPAAWVPGLCRRNIAVKGFTPPCTPRTAKP